MLPLGLPPRDFEQKTIDFARRVLDDIPECRDAEYSVRWGQNSSNKIVKPFLVLAFSLPDTDNQAAIAIGLVEAQKGTLLEAMPGNYLHEGDKLRTRILTSITDYLTHHGIKISMSVEGN